MPWNRPNQTKPNKKAKSFGEFVQNFDDRSLSLIIRGARGVIVIVVGNEHGDTSSKSWTRLIAFHIALILLGNVWIQLIFSSYG